jgi:uncharacterized membrane protein HdeD (DUF308 family)
MAVRESPDRQLQLEVFSMSTPFQQVEQELESNYKKFRWSLGISGALSVALGVMILVWPGISLFALTIVVGAYMAATGILGLVAAIREKALPQRGWLAFVSILSIVGGVLVLVWPNIGSLALLYVIGIYAIAFGVFTTGAAFSQPLEGGDRALLLFTGLAAILFGIVMFAKPGTGALVTLALIAAFSLIIGVSEIVLAIGGKRLFESRINKMVKKTERDIKQTERDIKSPRTPQPSAS